jgi:hypothetical protein
VKPAGIPNDRFPHLIRDCRATHRCDAAQALAAPHSLCCRGGMIVILQCRSFSCTLAQSFTCQMPDTSRSPGHQRLGTVGFELRQASPGADRQLVGKSRALGKSRR